MRVKNPVENAALTKYSNTIKSKIRVNSMEIIPYPERAVIGSTEDLRP